MCSAITRRRPRTGTRSRTSSSASGGTAGGFSPTGTDAAGGAEGGTGGAERLAALGARSFSRIRPPGPVPVTVTRSMPRSAANRRMYGAARYREDPGAAGGEGGLGGGAEATGPGPGGAAGGAVAAAAPADGAAPVTSMVTSAAPTLTFSPSWAWIFRTLPVFGDGISTLALSVSTETRAASSRIVSPSWTNQRTTSPSATPSPRSGNRNSYSMAPLRLGRLHRFGDRVPDARRVRQVQILLGVGERRIEAGDPGDGGLERVEGLLSQDGGDLGAVPAEPGRLMDDHSPSGLLHRGEDRRGVDRDQGPKVDELGGNAVGLEPPARLGRRGDHCAVGEDAHVGPLPYRPGLTDRFSMIPVGYLSGHRTIDPLRFEEDHRVGVEDGREQQSVRVRRRRRHDHLEPGGVGEVGLGALGVVQTPLDPSAVGGTDHYMARVLPARSVAELRELAHDLVEARIDEVQELDLRDGLEAVQRHSDGGPNDTGLRQRCVDDAVRAEVLEQSFRGPEHSSVDPDVLAEEEDLRVGRHGGP